MADISNIQHMVSRVEAAQHAQHANKQDIAVDQKNAREEVNIKTQEDLEQVRKLGASAAQVRISEEGKKQQKQEYQKKAAQKDSQDPQQDSLEEHSGDQDPEEPEHRLDIQA